MNIFVAYSRLKKQDAINYTLENYEHLVVWLMDAIIVFTIFIAANKAACIFKLNLCALLLKEKAEKSGHDFRIWLIS